MELEESPETTVGASTDAWSSLRRPPGIPANWFPRCPLPTAGTGRCRSLLRPVGDELDRLKCKNHHELWFPDDPRLTWKPLTIDEEWRRGEKIVRGRNLFLRLPADLVTALDRVASQRNSSRVGLIREALSAYPSVAHHLEQILATKRGEAQTEEQAELARKARVVASELITARDLAFQAIGVEELNLTPPSLACLEQAGLDTIGAINALSLKQMLALPGMRPHFFTEINHAISGRSHQRRLDQDLITTKAEALVDAPKTHKTRAPVEDILVLRDLRGMKWDQIGEVTGMAPEKVTQHYWRIKQTTLLSASVTDLDLGNRTYEVLAREGVDTIGQLLDRADELTSFPGFGDGMRNELQLKLYAWTELLAEVHQVPPKLAARLRSEDERILIGMRDDDKLSWSEIADRLEIRRGTARVRYHRAKTRREDRKAVDVLRAKLAAKGEETPSLGS